MYRESEQHNAGQPPESIYKTRFSRLSKAFFSYDGAHIFL